MKFTLDEKGQALPDVELKNFVENSFRNGLDIHISNALGLQLMRAIVAKTPILDRPKITWEIYGKEVEFDKNLRSENAWSDPRTNMFEDATSDILETVMKSIID